MERLQFIEDDSTGLEIVSLEDVKTSYPPHTHVGHFVIGIVTAGSISIRIDGQKIDYMPGVISIMPSKVHHEVHAGEEGLYLFAKFMPALC